MQGSFGYPKDVKKEYLLADRYTGISWLQKASYLGYKAATELLYNL